MLRRTRLEDRVSSPRNKLACIILVSNAFVWYLVAFYMTEQMMHNVGFSVLRPEIIWFSSFVATALSVLFGAFLSTKRSTRVPFLLCWMGLGTAVSLFPMMLDPTETNLLGLAMGLGASFGIGMPSAMAYFASSTSPENRGKMGGLAFLVIGLCVGLLVLGTGSGGVAQDFQILAAWRALGLIGFFAFKKPEIMETDYPTRKPTYRSILSSRAFLLYFAAWSMFCLIDQASSPVISQSFSTEFINLSAIIGFGLSGVTAVSSGLFCDTIGRKRVTITGFVLMGIGYASLGLLPQPLGWYVYVAADGTSWGIFYTVFFATIWGDLAGSSASEKFYALGGLPYLFGNFLRFMFSSPVSETNLIYVTSIASFFLFLAVLPLIYAPETLPEKRIRDIEVRAYVEKAIKTKEKYS